MGSWFEATFSQVGGVTRLEKLEAVGHLASCSQETFSFLCCVGPEAREWRGPFLRGLLISIGMLRGQAGVDNTAQAPTQANLI